MSMQFELLTMAYNDVHSFAKHFLEWKALFFLNIIRKTSDACKKSLFVYKFSSSSSDKMESHPENELVHTEI